MHNKINHQSKHHNMLLICSLINSSSSSYHYHIIIISSSASASPAVWQTGSWWPPSLPPRLGKPGQPSDLSVNKVKKKQCFDYFISYVKNQFPSFWIYWQWRHLFTLVHDDVAALASNLLKYFMILLIWCHGIFSETTIVVHDVVDTLLNVYQNAIVWQLSDLVF